MTIFLVRHGQDKDNENKILNGHRDEPLTTLGRKQAKIVAQKLKDNKIDFIYSSPLKRALETANIIAKNLGIKKITINQNLIERNFGILTGKPYSDIPKLSKKVFQGDGVLYFTEAEGAEDFQKNLNRAKKVLNKIQQKHPNSNVLLVTHGDTGKMIRAAFHKWTWQEALKTPFFDNTGVLELSATDKLE